MSAETSGSLSVFSLPISQGRVQKVLDRVSSAIEQHYDAIEAEVPAAPVNHVDETSWKRKEKLCVCSRNCAFCVTCPTLCPPRGSGRYSMRDRNLSMKMRHLFFVISVVFPPSQDDLSRPPLAHEEEEVSFL